MSSLENHFSIKEIREISERMDELLRKYNQFRQIDPKYILLDHADFLQLFKISSRTSFSWRSQDLLPHYVIGSKIYFRLTDIQELLEKHKIEKQPEKDADL